MRFLNKRTKRTLGINKAVKNVRGSPNLEESEEIHDQSSLAHNPKFCGSAKSRPTNKRTTLSKSTFKITFFDSMFYFKLSNNWLSKRIIAFLSSGGIFLK